MNPMSLASALRSNIASPPILQHLQQKRSQILAIAEHHGAYNLRIFGSVARGEAIPSSDIDILIDYDLEALLDRPVDIATPAMLKDRNRDRIFSEAIHL